MGTAVKSQRNSATIEEFLAYDPQGHSVVLRRSTAHPGASGVAPEPGPSHGPVEAPASGSLRFFADFKEVKALLGARARR